MALTKVPSNLITVDAIDGTLIANNAINSEHYTDGSIDTAHIAADQITSALIADDQIDSEHYVDGSIDLAHMSANSIDSTQYVDGSIDLAHMSDNSIDSDQYVDGSIDNAHLADDAVGVAELSASGTASSSTFLRGDNAWTAVTPAAIATYGNAANNRIITSVDSDEVNAEANLTFDGSTLAVTGAQTISTTLGVTGVLTANAGVVVDNITIDGTEIDLSSGDLTLDVAGDIILDADGADFIFKDAGSEKLRITLDGDHTIIDAEDEIRLDSKYGYFRLRENGTNVGMFDISNAQDFVIRNLVPDEDIIFKGTDSSTVITALTLDMSNAGNAIFNYGIENAGYITMGGASNKSVSILSATSNKAYLSAWQDVAMLGINRDPASGAMAQTGRASALIRLESYDTNAYMTFQTSATNNAEPTERMRIDKDGNVGIGITPTSGRNLHIYSADQNALKVQTNAAVNQIELANTSNSPAYITQNGYKLQFKADDNAWGGTASSMEFRVKNSEKMKIDSTGNVTKPSSSCFSGARNGGHVTDDQVFVGDTAHTNTGSDYNTSNGRYTAPVAGNYLIYADLTSTDSGSSATQNWWAIRNNGSIIRKFLSHKTGAYHHKISGTAIITLAANDYIEWYVGESGTTGGWVGSQWIFNNMGAVLLG